MTVTEGSGPARSFWNGAVLIFGGCLLLWFAAHVLQSIWGWLLAAGAVAAAIWALSLVLRWRRNRW